MTAEPRVLTLSLATSLDRYLWLDALALGSVNRPSRVLETAGGKSLNFARAACAIGLDVAVVALVGGSTGESVIAAAATERWTSTWIRTTAPTRMCTCILDEHTSVLTEFYEPVAPVPLQTWAQVNAAVARLLLDRPPDSLVLSGRQPDGLPADAYRHLISTAEAIKTPVWVDTAGAPLRVALSARPFAVKVNAAEATDLVEYLVDDVTSATQAAVELARQVTGAAVVTLGAGGAVLASGTAVHVAQVPALPRALPVGSGDSFLAGLIAGWYRTRQWPAALAEAAACSVANATRLEAGRLDPGVVAQMRDAVRVTRG